MNIFLSTKNINKYKIFVLLKVRKKPKPSNAWASLKSTLYEVFKVFRDYVRIIASIYCGYFSIQSKPIHSYSLHYQ